MYWRIMKDLPKSLENGLLDSIAKCLLANANQALFLILMNHGLDISGDRDSYKT